MTGGIVVRQDQKTLILGDYQTGKSTLAHAVLSSTPRWLAYDSTWMLPGGHTDMRTALSTFNETGRGVYYPPPFDEGPDFDSFCRLVVAGSNMLVYIDEPSMVMTGGGAIPPGFKALHKLGHKRGIGIMMGTHRFHGDLPALCRIMHHMFLFRTSIDIDIMALAGIIGRANATHLPTLPDHQFLYRVGGVVSGPHWIDKPDMSL